MPKILLVDDEENIRRVIKVLLLRHGYSDVLQAESGKEALEIIRNNAVDLVVSDVMMRGMDGLTLYRHAKDDGPVFVLLSAFATRQTAEDALKDGVFGIISKPYDEKEFQDLIGAALKERERRRKAEGKGGVQA